MKKEDITMANKFSNEQIEATTDAAAKGAFEKAMQQKLSERR